MHAPPVALYPRVWLLVVIVLAVFITASTSKADSLAELARETGIWARAEGIVPVLSMGKIDPAALRHRDALEAKLSGDYRKDLRIAKGFVVAIDPLRDGLWLDFDDGSRAWLLTVDVAGATELHLGFDAFQLPTGASLTLFSDRDEHPATVYDTGSNGSLWPAYLPGNSAMLVLSLPAGAKLHHDALRLSYVGAGYRHLFDQQEDLSLKSGDDACMVDIACPIGDAYRDPARAVARYTFRRNGFTYLCTGSLVANTARDLRPLFLSAHHCVTDASVADSMVLYFNYQSSHCGDREGTLPTAHIGGAQLLATRADVDTSLLELNKPPAESLGVYYAGWDRSGEVPGGSIGIDHPRGKVKSIVENLAPLDTTNSCILSGTQSTHWRTSAYAQGATMPGSSGSMLLVPADDTSHGGGLITGLLSGGSSACIGSMPNPYGDCYGKLAVAWDGPDAGSRLKDWLDPLDNSVLRLRGQEGPRPQVILDSGFEA